MPPHLENDLVSYFKEHNTHEILEAAAGGVAALGQKNKQWRDGRKQFREGSIEQDGHPAAIENFC